MTTLADRYVHAATRRLPEEQRADVGAELQAGIADRVDSLLAERPALGAAEAERVALVELGDPDRLAAGYTGSRLHLVGPDHYPAYVRVLTAVLVTALPAAVAVIAVIDALSGASALEVLGRTAWMAFTIAIHICFWVTLTFVLVERLSGPTGSRPAPASEWSPDHLPQLPRGSRAALGEAVTDVVWLAFLGAAIIWQQVRPPVRGDGERFPVLDPDLWTFWLPLVLALLVVEMGLEVVKYRAGQVWTRGFATVNTVLGLVFAAPLVYLAAADRLLDPRAVEEVQQGWSGFDPGIVNTLVVVVAMLVWVWDSVDGWRRTR